MGSVQQHAHDWILLQSFYVPKYLYDKFKDINLGSDTFGNPIFQKGLQN